MKSKYLKILIVFLAVVLIVPQIAFASWWNPASWGIWNRIFHFQQQGSIVSPNIVGFWQNCPSVAAGYCNRYHFHSNGTFEWYANQMACFNGVLAQKGTWKINNGKILLALDQQFSGQLSCGPDALPSEIKPPVVNKNINLSISDIFPVNTDISYYKYILIDNQKFYQLSNDPTFNNSEDQQVWNQTNNQTAGWKTYINNQYGIEIKYPEKSSNNIEVTVLTSDVYKTNISFDRYLQDINTNINSEKGQSVSDKLFYRIIKEFDILGKRAFTYEYTGSPSRVPGVETIIDLDGKSDLQIFVYGSGRIADVQKLEKSDYSDFKDLENINDIILSTFKFTK